MTPDSVQRDVLVEESQHGLEVVLAHQRPARSKKRWRNAGVAPVKLARDTTRSGFPRWPNSYV